MRRLSMFLVSAVAAALALAGCSSDSDAGGNPGGSAGAGAMQCVGLYAGVSAADFDDQTTSGKGCSTDIAPICSNDVTALVGTCGKTCFLQAASDDDSQAACVAPCIMQAVTMPKMLSDSCIDCYVQDVACARDLCLSTCGITPGSAECAQCRAANGCAASFYNCSGLPVPAGTDLGSAGAGD